MDNLKNIRLQHKYSFNQMANYLGISKTYYWQLEHDKRRITYEMAFKISQIFNKKPDDIFYQDYLNKMSAKKE